MPIIISQNGTNAVKVDKSSFDKEDQLQQYIYENPESIPLYDIKEDIKLLILARELPTNSGPIDAIGIDQDGTIYVVETKLYKNPDKRLVVSQALDYGAALWKHSTDFNEFILTLNNHSQKKFNLSVNDKVKEFFGLSDEELDLLLSNVKKNLSDGILKFVVLMDKLDSRLRDLILYINQNSQFDIYAVELEYYEHESYEIIIPRIYGSEVKKDINVKSSSSSIRMTWSEDMLLRQAQQELSSEKYQIFKKLYDFFKVNADEVRFGTGQKGSINPIWYSIREKSLVSLYTNGRLSINFGWLINDDRSNLEQVVKLKTDLQKLGFDIPEDYEKIRPGYDIEEWGGKIDEIVEILRNI